MFFFKVIKEFLQNKDYQELLIATNVILNNRNNSFSLLRRMALD